MTEPPVLARRSGLHLEYLDSLRGLSALYVAACHAYLMYAADFVTEGLRSASGALLIGTSWVMFGRAAVAVFIVLSGYCLMLPIVQSPRQEWRASFWPFMRRRAWRILPPYYGALACSAALIVLVPALADPAIGEWHKSFPAFGTGSVVSHLLLVHNYFPLISTRSTTRSGASPPNGRSTSSFLCSSGSGNGTATSASS
jgi:peptidoglycan/LPS O-acetylase OafA/YrhL